MISRIVMALAATSALWGDTHSIEHIVMTDSELENDLNMSDANGAILQLFGSLGMSF